MTPEQLIDLLAEVGMLKEQSPGVFGWQPTMSKAEHFYKLITAHERERLHDKFMEIHKSQQHSNNYWHFAARKIKEEA